MKLVNFNFLLLGMVFVPVILVNCKTLPKTYTSVRPSPFCNPSEYMRYPKNSDEVVLIVKEAIRRGVKVKALGSRHSETDIICTEGIPVDMQKIKFSKMNEDGTATFGAGITVKKLGDFLLKHRRALKVTPAYGGITLAGAIGTSAHGSSIKFSSTLSEQVVKMTIVNGLGKKLCISDPEDLKSWKSHLGLLGIVVDVTLITQPLYKILAHNYVAPDTVLTNGVALNWAKTTDQIMFYWWPAFKQVVVANLTFVPISTPGNAYTNAITPQTYGYYNVFLTKTKEIVDSLATTNCAIASSLGNTATHVLELISISSLTRKTFPFEPIYTENGKQVKNPAVGYAHKMLATDICSENDAGLFGKACFWSHGDIKSNISTLDNEISIPATDLPAFIKDVKDISKKTPIAFPLQGLWIRFSGMSNIYMHTSYQRHSAIVEFGFWKRKDCYNKASACLAGYQAILQTMVKKYKGRTHWGKTGSVYHSKEMIKLKLDPIARKKFIAAMKKFDPKEIFMNNFGRRLKGNGTTLDLDPRITRCALLDDCFCTGDDDCATSQSCTTLPGYDNYPVCKTRNEIAEVQFDRSLDTRVRGLFNWLVTVLPTLANSAFEKCKFFSSPKSRKDLHPPETREDLRTPKPRK